MGNDNDASTGLGALCPMDVVGDLAGGVASSNPVAVEVPTPYVGAPIPSNRWSPEHHAQPWGHVAMILGCGTHLGCPPPLTDHMPTCRRDDRWR